MGESGKRILVIGGSGALGSRVAGRLAEGGARVAVTYHAHERPARALAEAHGERIAAVLGMDAASVASIEAGVEAARSALGGLDGLVYAAAVGTEAESMGAASAYRMAHFEEAAWDRMLAVNLKGAFFAVRAAERALRAAGGGNIVLVGSVDGVKVVPSPAPYAASKAAMGGLVRALCKEIGEANIRVNVVAPGVMEGGLSRLIPKNLVDEYVKHCGLKRVGKLDEVAALVAWLAAENTYVTGQTLLADGAL